MAARFRGLAFFVFVPFAAAACASTADDGGTTGDDQNVTGFDGEPGAQCGGFLNLPCKARIRCVIEGNPADGMGTCVATPGDVGSACGGVAAVACDPGLTCKTDGKDPAPSGTCVTPPPPGEFGGTCNGAATPCKPGFTCKSEGSDAAATATCVIAPVADGVVPTYAQVQPILAGTCGHCHAATFATLPKIKALRIEMIERLSSGSMPRGNPDWGTTADGKTLLDFLGRSPEVE